MSEEKWIDEALNSLQGAERAKAPSGVFDDITRQIAEQQRPKKARHQWMAVAAVILLVLCSNAFLVNDYLLTEEVSDYQEEYPEMISNYTLYENE